MGFLGLNTQNYIHHTQKVFLSAALKFGLIHYKNALFNQQKKS